MARIPYPAPEDLTPHVAEIVAKLPPLNIFRMLGHAGDMGVGFVKLGNYLLAESALDPVLREIAIIRVGVLCKAGYEVQQHEAIGRKLGMSEALLAAIHAGPEAPAFDDLQRRVMAFTDDVVANVRASDATFGALSGTFTHREMQELVVTIGYYMMVSRFLETFDVDLEAAPDETRFDLPGLTHE